MGKEKVQLFRDVQESRGGVVIGTTQGPAYYSLGDGGVYRLVCWDDRGGNKVPRKYFGDRLRVECSNGLIDMQRTPFAVTADFCNSAYDYEEIIARLGDAV